MLELDEEQDIYGGTAVFYMGDKGGGFGGLFI